MKINLLYIESPACLFVCLLDWLLDRSVEWWMNDWLITTKLYVAILKIFTDVRRMKTEWLMHTTNSPYAWLRQKSKFHQQASFVNKIFCICTFCAWVFFSTLLPWEFISVKLRLFLISKRGLVVKFACV